MSYGLLKGKRGIIFGALDENSIAWKTAERVHEEGASFVLTNAPIAMRMGTINQLAEKTGSTIIPADATSLEDLEHLVTESVKVLGGKIDFVLHSYQKSKENAPSELQTIFYLIFFYFRHYPLVTTTDDAVIKHSIYS